MTYKPHQVEASNKAWSKLQAIGMVAIHGEPRVGKTRTAIRTASISGVDRVLVLTKKAAIPGWMSELEAVKPRAHYHVTNYEQVSKLTEDYDMLILDESHNLGCRGRPTKRVNDIRKKCFDMPLITLTGTPTIETPLGIYHQWSVSRYSPFREHKNFFKFFKMWGVPSPVWVNGRMVEQYKVAKPALLGCIEQYTVTIAQEDAGIEHRSQDMVHMVELGAGTRQIISSLMREGVWAQYVVDTDIGVRMAVHQIESGAVLYEDEIVMLPNTEVVDYIKAAFGDSDDVALFTHFRSTREKLAKHFKKAQLFSSIAHAEGVDMSHMKHMVVVNTGYSGAKAAQLRERVVNMNRENAALVHYIVTDIGVSKDVYDAVRNKVDFNLGMFRNARARYSAKNSG